MTRIGVIGGGNIGRTVGAAWQRAGHDVVYSSRSPAPPESVSIPDAIAHAEVVLLSTPGDAVPGLLAEHGAALDGRVVIDATNDVGGAVDGVGRLWLTLVFRQGHQRRLAFRMLTDE
jgi:8-hydroxy-5-deazaflavin:NADPH oxidoreductase